MKVCHVLVLGLTLVVGLLIGTAREGFGQNRNLDVLEQIGRYQLFIHGSQQPALYVLDTATAKIYAVLNSDEDYLTMLPKNGKWRELTPKLK